MSIMKSFYFSESKTRYLQLLGQVTNITNHPIFGYPNTMWGSGGFGAISSMANSPRYAQVAVKIFF